MENIAGVDWNVSPWRNNGKNNGRPPLCDWTAVLARGEGRLDKGVDYPATSNPRAVMSSLHQNAKTRGLRVETRTLGTTLFFRVLKPCRSST